MDIRLGDILELKKEHPCRQPPLAGSFGWAWISACSAKGCGHELMIPRAKAEKSVKKINSN